MDNKDVTAKWARETATSNLGVKVEKELNECLNKIKNAVAQNQLSVSHYGSVYTMVVTELKTRGFTVEKGSNQRDGSWLIISW